LIYLELLEKYLVLKILKYIFKIYSFGSFAGIIILYSVFKLNSGEIRMYLFFSMLLGIIIYTIFISRYIILIGKNIFKLLINTFNMFFSPIRLLKNKVANKKENRNQRKRRILAKNVE